MSHFTPMFGPPVPLGPVGNGFMPPAAPLAAPLAPAVGANPLSLGGGLASRVPVGVGQQAFSQAMGLGGGGGGVRLPSLPSLPRPPGLPGGGLNPGGLSAGRLAMRGLGGFTAGSIGSSLVDQLNPGGQNSNIEQGLQGAALGAGIGAAAGAPLLGIGAVPGALIGGAIGGVAGVVSNFFGGGGDDGPDPAEREEMLASAITEAGLDDFTTAQILDTYEASLAFAAAEEDDDLRAQKEAAALQQAEGMVLQAIQSRQNLTGPGGAGGMDLLALQAQAQQTFEPLAQSIQDTGSVYATAMGGLRDQLPPEYQAIADSMVAREVTSSTRLADAYRAQAAMTPIVQRLTQYQQDQAAFANQMFQQALAQQAAGGGATDVSALLQPTG